MSKQINKRFPVVMINDDMETRVSFVNQAEAHALQVLGERMGAVEAIEALLAREGETLLSACLDESFRGPFLMELGEHFLDLLITEYDSLPWEPTRDELKVAEKVSKKNLGEKAVGELTVSDCLHDPTESAEELREMIQDHERCLAFIRELEAEETTRHPDPFVTCQRCINNIEERGYCSIGNRSWGPCYEADRYLGEGWMSACPMYRERTRR